MSMPKNRRERDERERKIRAGVVFSSLVLGLIGMLLCGYGHTAMSTELYISGIGTVMAPTYPFEVGYMQDMTTEARTRAEYFTTAQMIDKRDGNKYWVTKFRDGKCWMTQDLRLRLEAGVPLTPELSDVTKDWTPPASPYNTVSSSTISGSYLSYDFGEYIYLVSNTTGCGLKKSGLRDCPSNAMLVGARTPSSDPNFSEKYPSGYSATEYDAHRLIGIYYQRTTVNVGTTTNLSSTTQQGTQSICPKGWRVPSGIQSDGKTDYMALTTAEGVTTSNDRITKAPYYFHKSGYIVANTNTLFGYLSSAMSYTTRNGISSLAYVYTGSASTGSLALTSSGPVRCVFYGA